MTPGDPRTIVELVESFAGDPAQIVGYVDSLEERFAELEPDLQAWMGEPSRFARVRGEAEAAGQVATEGAERPALFGLPVGIKDIFRVEGLQTTAGSRLPTTLFEGPESVAVARLREAGAIVLGKTVSTEFAYFGPGPTRNPRDRTRTPGGSSSGSAAAVAAGLVPLALGTQTIGSISRPAAFCGVVGFKPTYDRIPRDGVIPLSPSLDHVGLFTRDVEGATRAASVLCDGWSAPEGLREPVLAIAKGPMLKRATPPALHQLKAATERLAAGGLQVQVVPCMADFDDIESRHRRLVAAEAAAVHANWYADFGALYHPKTVQLILAGREVSEDEVARAREGRAALRQELEELMVERGVDLWLSPPAPGVAPVGLDSTGDPVLNLPWSHSGLPTLTVPSGADENGLPYGLQIAGAWNADERLLAWGRRIETLLRDA